MSEQQAKRNNAGNQRQRPRGQGDGDGPARANGAKGGGGAKNGGGNGSNGRGAEQGRTGNRRRKAPRKKKVDPLVFWGDPEQLAEVPETSAVITTNPSAVVESLGRPPLSGQQNAAEHYFVAVYERAVNLAAALAAAGNLIEAEDLTVDRN